MEEREDTEMRQKKYETDRLFLLYQQEKDKKRKENAQALSDYHLSQEVSHQIIMHLIIKSLFHFSKNEKNVKMH
jgi:hypothetical protein